MKNSSYYIASVADRTHDLPHAVASNMVKVSHALNHSATAADGVWLTYYYMDAGLLLGMFTSSCAKTNQCIVQLLVMDYVLRKKQTNYVCMANVIAKIIGVVWCLNGNNHPGDMWRIRAVQMVSIHTINLVT